MANKQSTSNGFVRSLLTFIGEEQELRVRGVEPGELRGKKIRTSIIAEFKGRCVYCGKQMRDEKEMQVDHLISMNKGNVGLQIYGNLVLSCGPCNNEKADADFKVFLKKKNPSKAKEVIALLESRRKQYGANIDVSVIKPLVETAYTEIGALLEKRVSEAIELLGSPSSKNLVRAQHDFSEISALFPLRSWVRSNVDGVEGEVYGYSMEGPKGLRTARVRFITPSGRKVTRARSTIELISKP